jgi:peptide/nickel transport system permease protein
VGGAIVAVFLLVALVAPLIQPANPIKQNLSAAQHPPGTEYWLGADELGRDILSRIIAGARLSLLITGSSVTIALVAGSLIGIAAALYSGLIDSLLMRVMDVLLALPGILLAITLIAVTGPSIGSLVFAIGVSTIPLFARVSRGSTLIVLSSEYITAARSLGIADWSLITRHVLPNIVSPLIIQASLRLATAILTASGLSFLGLGPQPPSPEWGAMLSTGRSYLTSAPHIAIMPGLAIMLVVFGFNLLGDGLRDAFDSRQRDI